MGYYSFKDKLSAFFDSFKYSYFKNNVDSVKIEKHIDNIKMELPPINGTGSYIVTGSSLDGEVSPVVHIAQWIGDSAPTMMFHHSEYDRPVTKSFDSLFLNKKYPVNTNLILVEASSYGDASEYKAVTLDVSCYLSMLAASVKVTDLLVEKIKKTKSRVYVCGISMGGWITMLHHAAFDTADAYIPILSGAGMGNYFIDSAYNRTVSSTAKRQSEHMRNLLNFDDFFMSKGRHQSVYPLLAEHDQYALLKRQMMCYGDIPIKTIGTNHVSGVKAYRQIRKHVLSILDKAKR